MADDFLESNLQLLKVRFPRLEKKLRNLLPTANLSRFEIKNEDFFEDGILIDSEASEFWNSLSLADIPTGPPARVLLAGGLGLGIIEKRIRESPLQSFQDLLLVEPSYERFLFVMKHCSLQDILENQKIHLIVGETPEETFASFVQFLRVPERAFRMDAFRILEHPVIAKQDREHFDIVWDEWLAAQKQLRRHFGTKEDSIVGFKYVCENISWIEKTPGVIQLKNQFAGLPAIIISTGPSLDRSIEDLKRLKDKAVLLAADASLSILLNHGIEPHFVLSLERDLWSKKFFEKSSSEHPNLKSNLIAYPLVPQESLREFKGPHWVAYRDYGYFLFFEGALRRGVISSATSVAHFCLRLAEYMGCSSAALVGQDLAFDPDDFHSHAAGVAYNEWSESSNMAELLKRIEREQLGHLVWVEGNLRNKVPTHSVYFSFMKEFSWEASQLSIAIYNCTEGGARIPGLKWKRLREVSETWEATGDLFHKISSIRAVPKESFDRFKSVQGFLLEVEQKFQTILSLTANLELNDQLLPEQKMQTVRSLRAAQIELYKDPRFVCFVIQNAGLELLDIENEWACLREDDFARQMKVLRRWTELTGDVAHQIRAHLEMPFQAI